MSASKPPEQRQRRNKTSGAALLSADDAPDDVPPLPGKRWRQQTRDWWAAVWRSPMAGRFLETDYHALTRLAALVNLYWRNPTTTLGAEIRQEEARFGLTPLDRQRLQWSIVPPEPVTAKRPDAAEPDDPRITMFRKAAN